MKTWDKRHRPAFVMGSLLCLPYAALSADAIPVVRAVPDGYVAQSIPAAKYSLVIGVQNYAELDEVKNATNDAMAVSAALHKAGFGYVRFLSDPSSVNDILTGVSELVQQARPDFQSALMFVFFAGHGVQVDGTNLLVPAGARKARLLEDSLPVSLLLSKVVTDKFSVSVFMLDACRSLNSPDAVGWTTPIASTGVAGFQTIQEFPNTIIQLSTSAGKNAQSFSRFDPNHSPFSRVVSQQISVESLSLAQLYGLVKSAVGQDMNGSQTPVLVSTAVPNHVSLFPGMPEAEADKAAWKRAQAENRRNCFDDYVSNFPAGNYAYSAKYLLSLLGDQRTSEPTCLLGP